MRLQILTYLDGCIYQIKICTAQVHVPLKSIYIVRLQCIFLIRNSLVCIPRAILSTKYMETIVMTIPHVSTQALFYVSTNESLVPLNAVIAPRILFESP